jgi:molybdopterin-guanine dinucleotide biosynthesis protein A
MRWTQTAGPQARWVASASSDVPLLPRNVVKRLHTAAVEGNAPIAFAQACGRQHPVIALWSIDLADRLAHALDAGEYRVRHWAAAQGTVSVDFAPLSIGTETVDPFFNANTPEELAEARALLAQGVP